MDTVKQSFIARCSWCDAFVEVCAGCVICSRSNQHVLVLVNKLAHWLLTSEAQKEDDVSE